ncbi:MAG: LCP family protein, partial [Bifidobacteriaceae bacterium]|nr:LCP family protein [Bifidobacteriaceae bacterium]
MTGSNPHTAQRSGFAPKHAKHYRTSHTVRTAIACFVLAIVAFVLCFAGSVYVQISGRITASGVGFLDQDDGDGDTKNDTLDPYDGQAITMLILGQDTRDGAENAALGGGELANEHQADTTMVAQISADRSYINIVSIPRDSIVDRPSCKMSDGSTLQAEDDVMFNSIFASAYSAGGDLTSAASCAVHSVNYLTGLNIDQFIVVDFAGMSEMVNALGGVDICLPTDVNDAYSGLNLSAGVQHLDGTQATQYARTRHGLGDGSDIMRTTRQQYLIKRLIRTALQKNLIAQSNQLYQFALAALNNLNMSSGLANVNTLIGLAQALSGLNVNRIYSRTIPVTSYDAAGNRVVWDESAKDVWKLLRDGDPLQSDATTDTASTDSSSSDA